MKPQAFESTSSPEMRISLSSARDETLFCTRCTVTLRRPDEVVMSKEDYERYTVKHPIFQNVLEGDLVHKTFLFLGFSFSDPNLNYMLGHLDALLEESKHEHYAVMRCVRLNDRTQSA